jgi:hypothetical protein
MLSDKQEKDYLNGFKKILNNYIGEEYNHGILMHLLIMFKIFLKNFIHDSDKIIMFNTDRNIESFEDSISIIENGGFKPIGVSQIYLEDVFIFETEEEAERAYNTLDKETNMISAFWYSKYNFLDEVIKYEKEYDNKSKVKIIWL